MCGSLLSLLALLSSTSSDVPSASFSSRVFFFSSPLASSSSRGATRGCRHHHPRTRIAYISGTRGRRPFIPTGAERVAIPRGEPPWSCKSNKPLEGPTKSREKDLKKTKMGRREGRGDGERKTCGFLSPSLSLLVNANRSHPV